jgi:hypothetical protein
MHVRKKKSKLVANSKKFVQHFCGKIDGKSGKRISELLLKLSK